MGITPGVIMLIIIGVLAGGLVYLALRDLREAQAALQDYCVAMVETTQAGYQAVTDGVDCAGWAGTTMQRVQDQVLNCHHLGQGGQVLFERCLQRQDLLPPGVVRRQE